MVEHKSVLTLAGIILEKAFDPDADICILARQVLRKNDHISSLEAENARLSEALERVIDNVETGSYESTGIAIDEARAALASIDHERKQ